MRDKDREKDSEEPTKETFTRTNLVSTKRKENCGQWAVFEDAIFSCFPYHTDFYPIFLIKGRILEEIIKACVHSCRIPGMHITTLAVRELRSYGL